MNQYRDNEIYSEVSEAEMESWDFQHNPSSQGRFSYRKRQPSGENYRVLGESQGANARQTKTMSAPRPLSSGTRSRPVPQPNSRPNRYNASVKMVADGGPAPWEWEQAHYRKMPVVGEVAAGRFDVTVAYHEPGYGPDADYVMVNPGEIKVGRNTFALRVRGQSMIDNEIDDGDIIIVEAQNWAEDGDFVIACLTDSTDPYGFVTLKRFYRHRQSDRIVLQPANQSLSPIHILPHKGDSSREDLDGVKIQGRVSAIIKTGGLL
jgi:SOS-response transcriptional repressor LexA